MGNNIPTSVKCIHSATNGYLTSQAQLLRQVGLVVDVEPRIRQEVVGGAIMWDHTKSQPRFCYTVPVRTYQKALLVIRLKCWLLHYTSNQESHRTPLKEPLQTPLEELYLEDR